MKHKKEMKLKHTHHLMKKLAQILMHSLMLIESIFLSLKIKKNMGFDEDIATFDMEVEDLDSITQFFKLPIVTSRVSKRKKKNSIVDFAKSMLLTSSLYDEVIVGVTNARKNARREKKRKKKKRKEHKK